MTTTTNLEEVLRKATDMQFIGSRTIEAAWAELRQMQTLLVEARSITECTLNDYSGGPFYDMLRAWLATYKKAE